jgi:Protein of unknown function (DUF1761)
MRTNYPAVVVCAIVYWLLGGLWFDLLFSKQWMSLEHMSEAQASSANPVWIWLFILTFLLNLLIAFVLAQVCIWRNANTAARGATTGILLWLGIVGPIVCTTYMYEMRPIRLFAINEFWTKPLSRYVVTRQFFRRKWSASVLLQLNTSLFS